MKKITLIIHILLVAMIVSCKKDSVLTEEDEAFVLKQEALSLAKECNITDFSSPDQISSVEKIENEVVLLRRVVSYLDNKPYAFTYRYQPNNPKIEYTRLTCNYKDMTFKDSSYAKASGYWIFLNHEKYGGIDGYDPYIFLLTSLEVVNKP